MASNLRVDTILPSTGTTLGIGTASGTINFLGNSNIVTTGSVSIGGTLTYEDVTNVDSVGVVTARTDINLGDSIIHIGDTNTKIRFPAADTISVETAGAERLRIDNSGNISGAGGNILTDSTIILKNATSDSNGLKISQEASDESRIFNHFNGPITFGTSNTERVRIDSNGHVTQPYLPSFMAYGNASYTTISSGGNLQPYVFPNTAHNTGTHYNTTSGKFTAPVTGVYQLNWNLFCKSDTNQTSAATLEFYVVKNGSNVSRLHNKKGYGNMGDDQQVVNLSVIEQLSANDEISINAYAYTVQWRIYGGHTTFSGALIG